MRKGEREKEGEEKNRKLGRARREMDERGKSKRGSACHTT